MRMQAIFNRGSSNTAQKSRPAPQYLLATTTTEKQNALNNEIQSLSTRAKHDMRLTVFYIIALTMALGVVYVFVSTAFGGIAAITYQGLGITLEGVAIVLLITSQLTKAQDLRQQRKEMITLLVRLQLVYERITTIEHEAHGTDAATQQAKDALIEKARILALEIEDAREVNRRVERILPSK